MGITQHDLKNERTRRERALRVAHFQNPGLIVKSSHCQHAPMLDEWSGSVGAGIEMQQDLVQGLMNLCNVLRKDLSKDMCKLKGI